MQSNSLVSQVSRRRALRHAPLALALAAALGLAPLAVSAATITVTSGGDAGSTSTCTLRQAIVSMNDAAVADTACVNSGAAFGSGDTIKFDTGIFAADGSGTITLGGSRLAVTATHLTLDATANSQVTIDANHASGVLIDSAVSSSSLTLKHLTLTHGNVTTYDCDTSGWFRSGGGICSRGAEVVLQHSTVSGNSASDNGGGVYTYGGSVTLTNSTVSGNSAAFGGGIYGNGGQSNRSNVMLTGSTVSGNTATSGGGIKIYKGSATLINSTMSNNSAYWGGGIYASSASVTLTNSTVSSNVAKTAGNGIDASSSTASIIAWNSIVSGNTGVGNDIDGPAPSGGSNLIGYISNLDLGLLHDNGGPTQTMLPQPGSAAIDAGDATHCPATDQRGFLRNVGVCDVGAVEVGASADSIFHDGFDG